MLYRCPTLPICSVPRHYSAILNPNTTQLCPALAQLFVTKHDHRDAKHICTRAKLHIALRNRRGTRHYWAMPVLNYPMLCHRFAELCISLPRHGLAKRNLTSPLLYNARPYPGFTGLYPCFAIRNRRCTFRHSAPTLQIETIPSRRISTLYRCLAFQYNAKALLNIAVALQHNTVASQSITVARRHLTTPYPCDT